MNRLHLWILGAAFASFAAGINVGLVAPNALAAPPQAVDDADYDADYVRAITADYGLSSAQAKSLRMVMQKWRDEEVAAFRRVETRLLPEALQRELLSARGRMEKRLRAILDEEQRARYDLASRPK